MLDSGAVDMAILFRFNRPSGHEEKLLSVAHTYLIAAPGDALTKEPTVSFSRLSGCASCCLAVPVTGAMRLTKQLGAWDSL